VLIGKSLGTGLTEATTVSSNVATVTHASHGYAVNDLIVTTGTGTGGNDFAALYVIQSVTTNTYTVNFTASNGPVTSATEKFWFSGTRSLNPAKVKNVVRSSLGKYQIVFTSTQADAYYGALASGGSSTNQVFVSDDAVVASSNTQWNVDFETNAGTFADANNVLRLFLSGIQ
jgi:hypothetical protein